MECKHEQFHVHAEVDRLVSNPDFPHLCTVRPQFYIGIKVQCIQCGLDFEWLGMPIGVSSSHPTMSFDRKELRAPIVPSGTVQRKPPVFTHHIAGEAYEGLQCCVLCGGIVSDYRNTLSPAGSPPLTGYAPGDVWISSGNPRISTTIDPATEGAEVKPCTPKKGG